MPSARRFPQTKPPEVTVEQAEAFVADNYVTGLYQQ
jgi:hypothetical protein